MGEAKRRKMLDPNYGKARTVQNNVKDKNLLIINTLTSLPNDLCWEIFTASNSSDWLGDGIEIPRHGSTQEVLEALLGKYTESSVQFQTIENLDIVCSGYREKHHSIWCNVYRILCLVDNQILLKLLKNKSPEEIDYLLRSMVLFENACPSMIDDEQEFWDDETSPSATEISSYLFEQLSSQQEYSNSAKQQIKAFCSRVGLLFSQKWAENWG